MNGVIKSAGEDENGNVTFCIDMYGVIFPVGADEVLLRKLSEGDEASFMTDRETGDAHITFPRKVMGGGVERE